MFINHFVSKNGFWEKWEFILPNLGLNQIHPKKHFLGQISTNFKSQFGKIENKILIQKLDFNSVIGNSL